MEDIKYPDGWLEEDLEQWCLEKGVPVPKWAKPKLRTLFQDSDPLGAINKATWNYLKKQYLENVFAINQILGPEGLKASDFDYPGGKVISEQFTYAKDWSQKYSTYGNLVIDKEDLGKPVKGGK